MSQAANPLPTSGWTVIAQVPRSQVNSTGQLVKGMEVSFTSGGGVSGSVWVPLTDYNVETVRALIAHQVATFDAVGHLTGSG